MQDRVELVNDVDFAAQPELDPASGSEHAAEDDFAPPLDPAEPAQQHQEPQHNRPKKVEEIIIDTTSSSDVPRLLHMIHNAGKCLEVKLIHYADSIDRLGGVADLVSKKESKERFFSNLFLFSFRPTLVETVVKFFRALLCRPLGYCCCLRASYD